jgi:hypothetical protein
MAKVTVPVGFPTAGLVGATVAVNVTGCPVTDGFDDDDKVGFVAPRRTVWEYVPLLIRCVPSPGYETATVY